MHQIGSVQAIVGSMYVQLHHQLVTMYNVCINMYFLVLKNLIVLPPLPILAQFYFILYRHGPSDIITLGHPVPYDLIKNIAILLVMYSSYSFKTVGEDCAQEQNVIVPSEGSH